ncbi:MAG TPA: PilZ domain-containing protein [Bryobacteraceae bacterium]|jgi:hypothetical protein
MEQRRAPRVPLDRPVAVTIYGELQDTQVNATVKSASTLGLSLELPIPVEPGAAIRIRVDDAILLGEAVHCRFLGKSYLVGVRLEQALSGLAELARAVAAFEELEGQVSHALQHRNREGHEQTPEQ